jgi:hypothetical protein
MGNFGKSRREGVEGRITPATSDSREKFKPSSVGLQCFDKLFGQLEMNIQLRLLIVNEIIPWIICKFDGGENLIARI